MKESGKIFRMDFIDVTVEFDIQTVTLKDRRYREPDAYKVVLSFKQIGPLLSGLRDLFPGGAP